MPASLCLLRGTNSKKLFAVADVTADTNCVNTPQKNPAFESRPLGLYALDRDHHTDKFFSQASAFRVQVWQGYVHVAGIVYTRSFLEYSRIPSG